MGIPHIITEVSLTNPDISYRNMRSSPASKRLNRYSVFSYRRKAIWVRGFTLIELLVVISIIIILVSMTVIMLPGMLKYEGLKTSTLIVRGTFDNARQLAANERIMYFISFVPDKGVMLLYRDTDEDKILNPDKDERIGQPVSLARGVFFTSGADGPPLFRKTNPYLGFRNDGSVMFPEGVTDLPLSDKPTPATTDIVLEEKNGSAKMFLDIDPSGTIRKSQLVVE